MYGYKYGSPPLASAPFHVGGFSRSMRVIGSLRAKRSAMGVENLGLLLGEGSLEASAVGAVRSVRGGWSAAKMVGGNIPPAASVGRAGSLGAFTAGSRVSTNSVEWCSISWRRNGGVRYSEGQKTMRRLESVILFSLL